MNKSNRSSNAAGSNSGFGGFKKRNRSGGGGFGNGGGGRGGFGGRRSFGGPRGGGSGSRRNFREPRVFDPSQFVKAAVANVKADVAIKHEFSDFLIHDQIKKNIYARNYEKPTPIQDQIIPHILEGRDIIGAATTGTGKTAAFLIPLIDNVLNKRTERVLILAPTRELAEQIYTELNLFKKNLPISSALCIGGASIGLQIRQLERYPHFVVGTPGRLADLEERNKIDFSEFTSIVLDEFDMMLDMGFINEVKNIMAKLPTSRHTVFFSATMPKKMVQLVDSFLNNPVKISVISQPAAENVNQDIIKIDGRDKLQLLCELLNRKDFEKVLVFGGTKRETNNLSKALSSLNIRVAAIHGDKSQDQRKRALNQFRSNKVSVLLATDVVSRGLDIDNVTHVINYSLPQTYEDYIHRIGRTGRGNKTGTAITFVN